MLMKDSCTPNDWIFILGCPSIILVTQPLLNSLFITIVCSWVFSTTKDFCNEESVTPERPLIIVYDSETPTR